MQLIKTQPAVSEKLTGSSTSVSVEVKLIGLHKRHIAHSYSIKLKLIRFLKSKQESSYAFIG